MLEGYFHIEDSNDSFREAVTCFLDGNFDDAKAKLESVVQSDESYVFAYCYLSLIYNSEGDLSKSLDLCNQGLQLDSSNAFLRYCLGLTLEKMQKFSEALEEYLYYLNVHPNDDECLFQVACVYDELDRSEEANQIYWQIVSKDDFHYKARFNLALNVFDKGDRQTAFHLLKRCTEIEPSFWKGWVKLGIFASHLGQFHESIIAYQKALQLCPDLLDIRYNLGLSLRLVGEYEEASACFRAVVEERPEDKESWHNLGLCLLARHHLEEAEKTFGKVLSICLEHEEAHYRLGLIYYLKEEFARWENEVKFLESVNSPYAQGLRGLAVELK